MVRSVFVFIILLLIAACNRQQEQAPQNTFAPKITEAKGYVVPKDSVGEPVVIPVDESKLKKLLAGKPEVRLINTNVHIAGIPRIIQSVKPNIYTPGQDTFSLPKVVHANINPVKAGIPVIIIAKDAYIKENNSQNFSTLSKLQGLAGTIKCMLQDKNGNIWFGTDGTGATKYDGKTFTVFSERTGLTNNRIFSILEDSSGNIWFGTGAGVSKYDGKCFTNFTEKEGFANNVVRALLQDKNGNIWFGTIGGACKYDGKDFTYFTKKEGLNNFQVASMLQDKDGNIWFGCSPGGVSKYDGKSFTNFTEKEGLVNNDVISILQDNSGDIWLGTYTGGVSILSKCGDKGSNQYIFTNYTEKEGLPNNMVWSIIQDKKDNIWCATPGGVIKYDGKYMPVGQASFTVFTENEGLSNNNTLSILQDKSGNIWIGTSGGASKYNGKSFTFITQKEGLAGNCVMSINKNINGDIWIGIYGGGVSKYDGKSFTNYTKKEGLLNNFVMPVLQDKSGNIWFGTEGGLSKYNGKYFTNFTENEGLLSISINSILEDKRGNIWVGTNGGGVSKYDGKSFTNYTRKEGLINDIIYSMLEDKIGDLWFGTSSGVCKYDGKYFTNFTKKEGFSDKIIFSMYEDKSENIWFGTLGDGVIKYDGKYFTHYTEKEGLNGNTVGNITQDRRGNLWFGTGGGLNKLKVGNLKSKEINPELPLFKYYGYDDGFLGMGVTRGKTICESNDGNIWIGSSDKLYIYHPKGDEPDTIPPNIQLTGIDLFNENVDWSMLETKDKEIDADTSFVLGNGVRVGDFEFSGLTRWYNLPENLSLAYDNNYLTFNFIGIAQLQTKKVKYKYKLEGLDENWSAISDRTEAPYGNIPQGSYTFKVKAMNSEGYWSNEFNYTFAIRPPWWNTWWFRTIYISLFVILLFVIYRWRTASLRKRQKELEIKVEEATAEIRQQNEEITTQRDEIEAQRDLVTSQKDEIEAQRDLVTNQKEHIEEIHKDLTDSINYAERIQRSFLATKELLDENLKEHFVFFHPKDVVSGDFYWASKIVSSSGVENFVLVTADSTGHGVPGAIMSILNISSLEKAVDQNLCEPSEILNHTRNTIIERLKKDGSPEGGKDGMDASLIYFDFANSKFKYSSANNPIWVIRETQLIELNPDKMPVGKSDKDQIPFTQNEFQLQKGDVVYTLTDGMPDQFGGPNGKKFLSKNLKQLLLGICHKPMSEQKEILDYTIENWKNSNGIKYEQTDDITILGIRI